MKCPDDFFLRHALVRGNSSQNRLTRTNPKRIIRRSCNALMRGLTRLQEDVALCLMHSLVSPTPAKVPDQILTFQIAGKFHARAGAWA
jgi:hypothetical protein